MRDGGKIGCTSSYGLEVVRGSEVCRTGSGKVEEEV